MLSMDGKVYIYVVCCLWYLWMVKLISMESVVYVVYGMVKFTSMEFVVYVFYGW